MLEAIERIESYTQGMDASEFASDRRTYDAVVRNLEIIGEASKYIPPELTTFYTDAPWRVLGDLRNKAIHDYNGLSPKRIFQTVRDNLPGLKMALGRMVAAISDTSDG